MYKKYIKYIININSTLRPSHKCKQHTTGYSVERQRFATLLFYYYCILSTVLVQCTKARQRIFKAIIQCIHTYITILFLLRGFCLSQVILESISHNKRGITVHYFAYFLSILQSIIIRHFCQPKNISCKIFHVSHSILILDFVFYKKKVPA